MTTHQWTCFVIGLIDDLERRLCPSAPKTARLRLAELRKRAGKATTSKVRKSCERRLDRLTESAPFFREAARRHVSAQVEVALDGTERLLQGMIKLARVRSNKKAEKGITKILAGFRKKRHKAKH